MKTVDVIVPVHNSSHWLSWCLEELCRFEFISLQNIYVVNDHSEAEQTNRINEIVGRYQHIKLINNNDVDGGFGYACNLGATQCSSELLLFLNTDCLVTDGVLDILSSTFDVDSKIALVCPLSNNSSNITYPMLSGFSYRDMSKLLSSLAKNEENEMIIEACTVVGNCLMVRRDFFESVGGFSAEWGVGYGEETDLHLKALSKELRGVVNTGCYVYHYGGGTFNYELEIETHRQRNYQLFMSKWSKEYDELAKRCEKLNPIEIIDRKLEQYWDNNGKILELDVLFYLPGIDQAIGGVNAVISICNDLIKRGIKAGVALVSPIKDQLRNYKEPILFDLLYFDSDTSFLSDTEILPKVVFSTIFYSSPVVAQFASDRNSIAVQFVQGYEGYFENGVRYNEAVESYKKTEHLVTTSNWLFNMVKRHLTDNQEIKKLPLVINSEIFFSGNNERPIDIILILRSSPDKGQWLLIELLDRLAQTDKLVTVLCSSQYSFLKEKYKSRVKFIDLPLDQYSLAKILRQAKVFVDKSLHEGYGLMPLEAALCGCHLVASDSGGIRDFINNFQTRVIKNLLNPDEVISSIYESLNCFYQSKSIKHLELLNFSGQLWVEYFQNLTNDKPLPAFQAEFLSNLESSVLPNSTEKLEDLSTKLINLKTGEEATPVQIIPIENLSVELINLEAYTCDSPNISETLETTLPPDNLVKKIYKRFIFPNIPQRFHLALKILIRGKL